MLELAIAVFLILLNGVFALSELSIVSSRKARLKTLAAQHVAGASAALRLAESPGRFLSTVQIGITLVGVLAGAFSGAALGGRLRDILFAEGVPDWLADPLGYGIVISLITYLSVVIGELVPKQVALRNPERFACLVAPPMNILSKIGAPAVWLLDASARLIFRVLGQDQMPESAVTDEEIKTIVAEAEAAGVIEGGEKLMIAGVMRFSDRAARGLMTPRNDVDWIDLTDSPEDIRAQLSESPHSRLPVADGGPETIVGIVQKRELFPALLTDQPIDIRSFVRHAPIVPDSMDAMRVLESLRNAEVPMVLVHDEYGHFEGVVTPADVLEAIAGVFRSDIEEGEDDYAVQREDGSWLISGSMPIDEMAERLGLQLPPRRAYQTAAGLVIEALQRLPRVGEIAETQGWRFEVVDMDGRRVDKLLASRLQ
ncbi:hemolysin family protein [Sinorhizobium sp. BG8]|uniref:hemolysin family protein n=1 Tax=Sinorhizobium sp. BG8 TaxID=2613773 RepID=UPI00193D698A|nr:hemolysin family protein [Sinorhizobium sp. BG8]QRM56296.1 HlyC/CorC family transporter [Sinorhizobium sp. BG8]